MKFFKPKASIGIEGILAYQKIDRQQTDQGDSKSVYFNVGLQFYLPKKD